MMRRFLQAKYKKLYVYNIYVYMEKKKSHDPPKWPVFPASLTCKAHWVFGLRSLPKVIQRIAKAMDVRERHKVKVTPRRNDMGRSWRFTVEDHRINDMEYHGICGNLIDIYITKKI